MIRVNGLHKSYGSRAVLKGVELHVPAGKIVGIAGPNACGKSTLLKCLLGLAVPQSGEIRIAGKGIAGNGEFRRSVGYMPQNPQFPPGLKGFELLEMLEHLRGERAARKERLVSHFGLERALGQPTGELSGGTRQKLSAVAAFMFDAPVVLLDEPTAGMDPLVSVRFKELLAEQVSAGKAILLVSHLISEIEQLASSIIFLEDGQTAFSGEIRDLLSRTGAERLDLALTRLFEGRVASP